jgi:hypothetical protein
MFWRHVREQPRPARPRAIGCEGADGWVMLSHDRQENFWHVLEPIRRLSDRRAPLR